LVTCIRQTALCFTDPSTATCPQCCKELCSPTAFSSDGANEQQELRNEVLGWGAKQQVYLHAETLNAAAFCAVDSHVTTEHPKIHILDFHACFSPAVCYIIIA